MDMNTLRNTFDSLSDGLRSSEASLSNCLLRATSLLTEPEKDDPKCVESGLYAYSGDPVPAKEDRSVDIPLALIEDLWALACHESGLRSYKARRFIVCMAVRTFPVLYARFKELLGNGEVQDAFCLLQTLSQMGNAASECRVTAIEFLQSLTPTLRYRTRFLNVLDGFTSSSRA